MQAAEYALMIATRVACVRCNEIAAPQYDDDELEDLGWHVTRTYCVCDHSAPSVQKTNEVTVAPCATTTALPPNPPGESEMTYAEYTAAMREALADADIPAPVKNQAEEKAGQRVADIANSALTGEMQRIGDHVNKECAVSETACARTLDAVTDLNLTWGEDFRIDFDKDGRWDTKPRNDK